MLLRPLEEDQTPVTASNWKPRKGWRPYASRAIPFTSLQTPANDAILGLDRHGSYVLALSDKTSTPLFLLGNEAGAREHAQRQRQQGDGTNAIANFTGNSQHDSNDPTLALTFYGMY